MKIGIVTLFNVPNYGAILQAYALATYLRQLGHDILLFNVEPPKKNPFIYKLKRLVKLRFIDQFQRKYYPTITSNLKEKVDLYMVGSDQVWNPEITRTVYHKYFLSFALHPKKVAYAASFGTQEWNFDNLSEQVGNLLREFSYITVREEQGKELLHQNFHILSKVVLDPCFLLEANDYLFEKKMTLSSVPLLVSYKLCYDKKFSSRMSDLSRKLGCRKKELRSRYINSLPDCKEINIQYCRVEKWIYWMASSRYVVTDSFHGLVFSLIFRKQFVVFPSIPKRSSRIDNLLEKLNLSYRKVNSFNEAEKLFKEAPIAYAQVEELLINLKMNSKYELSRMIL